jgi:hypothetical protein
MNIKQYFAHLGYWVRTFPRWDDNEHTTTGIAGSGEYYCLLCDFVEIEKPNKACTGRRESRRKLVDCFAVVSFQLRRQ